MAKLKVVNADQLDADLTSIADSIRAKTKTNDQLVFPNDFKTAIDSIEPSIAEISTATEMDEILANATASDVGKFYLYVGPTTDKYENNALYRVTKITVETISFNIFDNTANTRVYEDTVEKGTTWGEYAQAHTDAGFLFESTVSFDTCAIYDGKTEIEADKEIEAKTYTITT